MLEYLRELDRYFSFILQYDKSVNEASEQLKFICGIVSPLEDDLDVDLFDLISKERLNNKISPFMHTEMLFMYILVENPLGLAGKVLMPDGDRVAPDSEVAVLSARDMCRVCEDCMGKFFAGRHAKCFIGSLEENDESWDRKGESEYLVKIPLDADNTDSVVSGIHGYRTGLKIKLDRPLPLQSLLEKSLFALDRSRLLERVLSARMEAFFQTGISLFDQYRQILSKPLGQITYRIVRSDKKSLSTKLQRMNGLLLQILCGLRR
ncbi:MAG: hypothetical protein LBT03_00090 [Holosporales bacterium]|jgi:hypothetical protein|nr:hypothetical protein [Holosporales bacterium]